MGSGLLVMVDQNPRSTPTSAAWAPRTECLRNAALSHDKTTSLVGCLALSHGRGSPHAPAHRPSFCWCDMDRGGPVQTSCCVMVLHNSARKGPSVAGSTAALPAALPAALVVFTTTTSPQLPPVPLPPPHVERGVSPVVLSRCDAGSGCRTSPLTLPSSPNNSVESPRNRENYYFWYCPSGTT